MFLLTSLRTRHGSPKSQKSVQRQVDGILPSKCKGTLRRVSRAACGQKHVSAGSRYDDVAGNLSEALRIFRCAFTFACVFFRSSCLFAHGAVRQDSGFTVHEQVTLRYNVEVWAHCVSAVMRVSCVMRGTFLERKQHMYLWLWLSCRMLFISFLRHSFGHIPEVNRNLESLHSEANSNRRALSVPAASVPGIAQRANHYFSSGQESASSASGGCCCCCCCRLRSAWGAGSCHCGTEQIAFRTIRRFLSNAEIFVQEMLSRMAANGCCRRRLRGVLWRHSSPKMLVNS